MSQLNVQAALRACEPLATLAERFALRVVEHPDTTVPLVALKYSQIDSPRFDPIVRECRGLVLERETWRVVAKPFDRFYNLGECAADEARFDPVNAYAIDKNDGSLIILYHYAGSWRVNTSGSFGLGEVLPGGPTWNELFWRTVPFTADAMNGLENYTLLFELCAHENKVVRRYATPTAFLIGAMRRSDTDEDAWLDATEESLDDLATDLGAERPRSCRIMAAAEAPAYVANRVVAEPDYEGVVLRDRNDVRIKVKSREYLTLSHMKDNGNLFRERNLVPWALREDPTELLIHFPECEAKLRAVAYTVAEELGRLVATAHAYQGIESQKEFALAIKDRTRFTGLLFQARKAHGKGLGPPDALVAAFRSDPERVAKVLFGDA